MRHQRRRFERNYAAGATERPEKGKQPDRLSGFIKITFFERQLALRVQIVQGKCLLYLRNNLSHLNNYQDQQKHPDLL